MEENTGLEDQNSHRLGAEPRAAIVPLGNPGPDEALADEFHQEGGENTTHDDRCRCALESHGCETRVFEHELGVRVQMNQCRRDDNTRTELFDNDEDAMKPRRQPLHEENGRKYTDGAGGHDDEQEADTKGDVVLAVDTFARPLLAAALALARLQAVLDAGVEMAVLIFLFGRRGHDILATGAEAVHVGSVVVAAGELGRKVLGVRGRRVHGVRSLTPHAETGSRLTQEQFPVRSPKLTGLRHPSGS